MCTVYGIDPSVNPPVHKLVPSPNEISSFLSHGLVLGAHSSSLRDIRG